MGFSSIPAYLDPSNWQQQPSPQQHQQQQQQQQQPPRTGVTMVTNPHLLLPPPSTASDMIRPGSMADRARVANIPMPESAMKCPRCDSTNTKFCYFNNYSLSQPRHFCKTCRRYWTRGGALRSVPVGGGCRRNKRTKGTNPSKSQESNNSSDQRAIRSSSTSSTINSSHNNNTGIFSINDMLGFRPNQVAPPLRFVHNQNHDFADMGLNYTGNLAPFGSGNEHLSFQIGNGLVSGGGGGGGGSIFSGLDQWRLQQQLPFLGGLDSSSGLYPFEGGVSTSGFGVGSGQVRPRFVSTSSGPATSMKVEDNQEMNLSRQLLGNEQYWSNSINNTSNATSWTDLSNFKNQI